MYATSRGAPRTGLPFVLPVSFDKIDNNSLNWDDHYNSILNKAYKILGLIRRTFSTNLIPVKKLYISLVRAQLLYCSQVWRPYKMKDILLLEQAQRRATKYLYPE